MPAALEAHDPQKQAANLDVGIVTALDSSDKVHPHARGEMGVLPICLTASTPPWVSKDINVGAKAVQTPTAACDVHWQ